MSLLFKIAFIAMICFHRGKEVTGMLNGWEQSGTRPDDQKVRLEYMWTQSRQITIERGVEEAFARCFKEYNETIWEKKDTTWAPLDIRWFADGLCKWFINDIIYQKGMLEKWQKSAKTSDRDLHLKERYHDPVSGAEGELCHFC
jgi:hypothetical protein